MSHERQRSVGATLNLTELTQEYLRGNMTPETYLVYERQVTKKFKDAPAESPQQVPSVTEDIPTAEPDEEGDK